MIDCVILDVDGTACDVSSIRHFVRQPSGRKDFDKFHENSVDCPPNHDVLAEIKAHHEAGLAIVVVTARLTKWFYHTMIWLYEVGFPFNEIYMRADNDFRPDVEIKREILAQLRRDGYNPVLAYDDNPSIIELWESEGIETVTVPGWE
jgi:phosphoglycolate phosphatase-like HAD superfamily hydrolase